MNEACENPMLKTEDWIKGNILFIYNIQNGPTYAILQATLLKCIVVHVNCTIYLYTWHDKNEILKTTNYWKRKYKIYYYYIYTYMKLMYMKVKNN